MPRKKNGMALRRAVRRGKRNHPNAWRCGDGLSRQERERQYEFNVRMDRVRKQQGLSYGPR